MTDRTTRREPHVSALFRYPLKSAAGIAVETLELDDVGAHLDRRWMLIDEAGRFISQREETRLALIRTALEGDRLTVSAPGAATYVIPDHDDSAPRERVTIWDDTVDAVSIGGEADEWFCEVLRTHCRLVYFPLDTIRLAERAYNPDGHRVGFADAYPLLVVGASSLADLNTRLAARGHDALPMNRFRPNIVIVGAESYGEEWWRGLALGVWFGVWGLLGGGVWCFFLWWGLCWLVWGWCLVVWGLWVVWVGGWYGFCFDLVGFGFVWVWVQGGLLMGGGGVGERGGEKERGRGQEREKKKKKERRGTEEGESEEKR